MNTGLQHSQTNDDWHNGLGCEIQYINKGPE